VNANPNDPEFQAWCTQMYRMLREGGVWGIPRNGLVFQKQGDGLVLISKMPHVEGMEPSPEELAAYQEDEYRLIKDHFEAAGIPVRRAE
jgi:hypothetical protein